MFTRRQFLSNSLNTTSVVAVASSIPCFLSCSLQAAESGKDGRILVVIELNGGNDGINTVIPYLDENYAKYRKTLRIPKSQVLKLNKEVGFHPDMKEAARLVEDGRLAVVQGVGYPNPNRSHFESMAIWQSAQLNPNEKGGFGWLGRALDLNPKQSRTFVDSICIGDAPPRALRGRRITQSTIRKIEEMRLDPRFVKIPQKSRQNRSVDLLHFVRRRMTDAHATAKHISRMATKKDTSVRYPKSGVGNRLKTIASLIRAELGPRVYYTVQSGYDTHVTQLNDHSQLVLTFSTALKAFLDDLRDAKMADRVLVLVFSEFGRRVKENDSQGTDHGTAGPVFLAGPSVKAGLHGKTPSLTDLVDGDLKVSTDFRSVYATVLSKWLNISPKECLTGKFAEMELFKNVS